MLDTPFHPWPSYTVEEAEAVRNVLLSNRVNYWTGNEGKLFEKEFAEFVDCRHAIAVANGTLALDMALHGLEVGSGDEVIVTSRTFIASVSSIVNAGARPVFADVNPDSQNITVETITPLLSRRTKAIICVHLAGYPCEMEPIMALAKELELKVIEDCAQAHGARYQGKSVGAIGHVGAWSFCQDKIMTTGGEGGMVTTNDYSLWHKMWSYKDHGKSYPAMVNPQPKPGFRWLHETFGTNARLTEMQSAIGRIQLGRMPQWQAARTRNAMRIYDIANSIRGLRIPVLASDIVHAWYKCYLFVEPELFRQDWDRDRIVFEINFRGVPCFTGSCSEVYLEKAFDNGDMRPAKRLPVARQLGETSIMFLVHPTLSSEEIEKTCQVLKQVMSEAVY